MAEPTTVIKARSSRMLHRLDCDWVAGQEHNSQLRFERVSVADMQGEDHDKPFARTRNVCRVCGYRLPRGHDPLDDVIREMFKQATATG